MSSINDTASSQLVLYGDKEKNLMLFVLITLALFAIVGNLVQFLAIFLETSLQTASNIFIVSLGCSDFGVGIITLPTVALTVYNKAWVFSTLLCKMAGVVDSVMITASMWTLGFTALDRYFLVQSPISHRNTMNKTIARKTVLFCWALSILVAVPPVLGWSDYTFSEHSMSCAMESVRGFDNPHKYYFLFYVLVSFPVPLLMIMVCYFLIFRFFVNKKNTTNSISVSKSGKFGGCRPVVLVSHLRTAKITLILILFVLACILPTFIIGMLFWSERITSPFSHQLSKAVIWSLLANSACNPILYGWFNKHFRSVYKQMFLSLILREKYSILRRSMLSMRSVHGTPKHSFNNNPLALDFESHMHVLNHKNFSNSLKLIRRYNSKLNKEPARRSSPAVPMCCTADVSDIYTSPRRHSIAGTAGDQFANVQATGSLSAQKPYRSQPDIARDHQWHLTTLTTHQ